MKFTAKKPEDILSDNQDYVSLDNGAVIRKGSMAATIANAKIVQSPEATEAEKLAAINEIKKLAPTFRDYGFNRVLQWKDPRVQEIFDNC